MLPTLLEREEDVLALELATVALDVDVLLLVLVITFLAVELFVKAPALVLTRLETC